MRKKRAAPLRGFCRLALSLASAGTAFSPCCRPFLVIAPRRRARGLGEKGGAVCENRPCSGLALLGLLLRRLLCLLRHCSLLMGGLTLPDGDRRLSVEKVWPFQFLRLHFLLLNNQWPEPSTLIPDVDYG